MSTAQTLADAVSALNNVATSHEQLNATMTAQQDVVEANFKALQDFATHPDTATFKDKNGTSFPVKSLRKLAADAEAVNPNPHVMSKAEFDALRELRKSQYAGSGFVEMGKHPSVFDNIDGMWFYVGSGWENQFALGSNKPTSEGKSLANYAQVLVDGVVIYLENLNSERADESTLIKLPPAPDGTKTYDSSTRIVTQHDNAEVAFASETSTNKVILSRKDLVFLEVWHEKVSEKDVVYPLGNVQFGASSASGIALSNILIAQGYSAFGVWDSSTKGYGVRWSTLSAANRNKFLSDPKNNIYFDAELGEYVQVRYRVRVVEGYGDQWNETRPSVQEITTEWASSYRARITFAQGLSQSITTKVFLMKGHPQTTDTKLDNGVAEGEDTTRGLLSHGQTKPQAIPIALVQRFNQGAHHPIYNPFGCAYSSETQAGAQDLWSELQSDYNSTVETFIRVPALKGGDVANTGTGRQGLYLYHDAILAGQVEDLRLSAKKKDLNQQLSELERKVIGGELRGKQKLKFTRFDSIIYQTSGSASGYLYIDDNGWDRPKSVREKIKGWNITKNKAVTLAMNPGSQHVFDVVTDDGSLMENNDQIMFSYYRTDQNQTFDILPCCDIAGHPLDIFAAFPNGVQGEWIPILPPSTTLPANRKIKSAYAKLVRSGGVWFAGSYNFDPVANNWTDGLIAGEVQLFYYTSHSAFTKPKTNLPITQLGPVVATADFHPLQGNRLSGSLLGIVLKDSQDGNQMRLLPMLQFAKTHQNSLWVTCKPRHGLVDLIAPSYGVSAVKTLVSIVEKHGLYYAQFNGAELKHNGTDWGDDQVIPVISGEDVKTDLNGNTVKVFCHHSVYPLGIAHND
ncbi:hypothetical protein [Pseudoalteromonas xiamenensis]